MSLGLNPAAGVAKEALEALDGSAETLFQLHALFNAIKNSASEHSDTARLAALGALVAMDHANYLDSLGASLRVATQITNYENVSRDSSEVLS